MKKLLFLFCVITLCFFVSCGKAEESGVKPEVLSEPVQEAAPAPAEPSDEIPNTPETAAEEAAEEEPPDDFVDDAEELPLEFGVFLEQINGQRREEMSTIPEEIESISQSHEYDNLLSHEECKMLVESKEIAASVTKEQASEDAEYLWKAFASAYAGYYYFGDDVFRAAHQQVLEEIQSLPTEAVSSLDFDAILTDAYSFIKDTHIRFYKDNLYSTYYVKGLFAREDTNGYYCLLEGKKWYLESVDQGDLLDYIQVTIADTGELVYGLYHRFLSDEDSDMPTTLTLKRGSRTTELPIQWTLSEAYGLHGRVDDVSKFYAAGQIDGHNIVAIRGFRYFDNIQVAKKLDKYIETGNTLSGQDYVIVDSRSNSGGSNGCPLVWMLRFLGDSNAHMENVRLDAQLTSSQVGFFVGSRLWEHSRNKFNGLPIRQGIAEYPREQSITIAEQTKNTHPLFFLTDNLSGSGGEGIISQARTVENVLVIGTNTYGCMFGSHEIQIQLPNTGYRVDFGQAVALEDFVNREGYGYDPDIWVPSEYALDLTLKLCQYYGLSDPDAEPLPASGQLPERTDLRAYIGAQ